MSCTAVVVGAYLEYFATIHGGGSGIRDTKTTKMEAARHMETGAPSHSKICFMDCQTNRNISTHWSTQSQVTSTAEICLPLYHNKFNSTTHENHQPNLTKGFTLQPGFFVSEMSVGVRIIMKCLEKMATNHHNLNILSERKC